MKNLVGGSAAALLCLVMAMPSPARAGNVGYYMFSGVSCGENLSPAAAITAAGHTPVAVTALDAASLSSLQGLVVMTCNSEYPGSAAVDASVANGMALMIDSDQRLVGSVLPGKPALDFSGSVFCLDNVSITPGSDVSSGPGGLLTDDSLDVGAPGGGVGGYCSILDTVDVASLPSGAHPYVFPAARPNQIAAFSYPAGNGAVVVSMSQWQRFLPGTSYPDDYQVVGARTYYTNAIAWMMRVAQPAKTCASEGYTGTKLTWCQNICEKGYSGATLETWIRRWMDRYRNLPYCAMPVKSTVR